MPIDHTYTDAFEHFEAVIFALAALIGFIEIPHNFARFRHWLNRRLKPLLRHPFFWRIAFYSMLFVSIVVIPTHAIALVLKAWNCARA